MPAHATITFSHPGVQGPVYVVTDLTSPPWEPLEMRDSGRKTDSGDAIFTREFEGDISEGPHQYKIRIGDGNWVLDTSKETASDDAGNLNNIVRASHTTQQELDEKKSRHDSVLLPANTPFVVVSKVPDIEQPTYGDVEPEKLPHDQAKRTADADPDYESTAVDATVEPKSKDKEVEIPSVVVEKVDQKPVHGDDFGDRATPAQKVAHEVRSADAQPDRVILNHRGFESYDGEFELAPRFSHEDGQSNKDDNFPGGDDSVVGAEVAPAFPYELGLSDTATNKSATMNTVDFAAETPLGSDETVNSSYQVSSDESPLLPHEMDGDTVTSNPAGDEAALLPHERDVHDELQNTPIFPHEATRPTSVEGLRLPSENGASNWRELLLAKNVDGLKQKTAYSDLRDSDGEVNELDRSSTLPHETNAFNDTREFGELGPVDADEGNELERGFHLLHEHSFAQSKMEDHDGGLSPTQDHHDDGIFINDGHAWSGFSHHAASSRRSSSLVGSNPSSPAFKRTSSNFSLRNGMHGTIAPSMPHSDAEDEDLKGSGYEVFPTNPEEILAKLSGIARRLSREDVLEGTPFDGMSSPEHFASQARSPVDLNLVGSHSSLTAIREAAVQEEAEDSNSDVSSSLQMTEGRGNNSGEGRSSTDSASGMKLASTSEEDRRTDNNTTTSSSLHPVQSTGTEATEARDKTNIPLIDESHEVDRSGSSASFQDASTTAVAAETPTVVLDVPESGNGTQDPLHKVQPQPKPEGQASVGTPAPHDVQTQKAEEQQKERGGRRFFASIRRAFTGYFGIKYPSRSFAVLAVVVGLLWYWWT